MPSAEALRGGGTPSRRRPAGHGHGVEEAGSGRQAQEAGTPAGEPLGKGSDPRVVPPLRLDLLGFKLTRPPPPSAAPDEFPRPDVPAVYRGASRPPREPGQAERRAVAPFREMVKRLLEAHGVRDTVWERCGSEEEDDSSDVSLSGEGGGHTEGVPREDGGEGGSAPRPSIRSSWRVRVAVDGHSSFELHVVEERVVVHHTHRLPRPPPAPPEGSLTPGAVPGTPRVDGGGGAPRDGPGQDPSVGLHPQSSEEEEGEDKGMFCEQCRVIGWGNFPVCAVTYHFVIPLKALPPLTAPHPPQPAGVSPAAAGNGRAAAAGGPPGTAGNGRDTRAPEESTSVRVKSAQEDPGETAHAGGKRKRPLGLEDTITGLHGPRAGAEMRTNPKPMKASVHAGSPCRGGAHPEATATTACEAADAQATAPEAGQDAMAGAAAGAEVSPGPAASPVYLSAPEALSLSCSPSSGSGSEGGKPRARRSPPPSEQDGDGETHKGNARDGQQQEGTSEEGKEGEGSKGQRQKEEQQQSVLGKEATSAERGGVERRKESVGGMGKGRARCARCSAALGAGSSGYVHSFPRYAVPSCSTIMQYYHAIPS